MWRKTGLAMLGTTALALSGNWFAMSGQEQGATKRKITEEEIKVFVNDDPTQPGTALCESLDQIHVHYLEYYDLTGDGQEEALVVASTCATGTAGPDVHSVYKRDANGKIVPLPFLKEKGDQLLFEPGYMVVPVFGNPNYELDVEDGKLLARWRDTSGRGEPAVVWYKWDGKRFVVDHKKVEGPFPTSYDCAKATKEMDLAICYAPSVAPLDVELGKAYREAMHRIPAEKKVALQSEQRVWLGQREKECSIYKWWVDCLTEMYTKRITELKAK